MSNQWQPDDDGEDDISPHVDSDTASAIVRAYYDTHGALGYGFPANVYAAALEIDLTQRGIAVERERLIKVRFRETVVGYFRADLLVNQNIVIQLCVEPRLPHYERKKIRNQLRAGGFDTGFLLHYGPRFRFHVVHYLKAIHEDLGEGSEF
jgi:GxxExxY protein